MFKEPYKEMIESCIVLSILLYLEFQGFSRYRGPLNVKRNKKKELVSSDLLGMGLY